MTTNQNSSSGWLIFMGMLWLLLAVFLLYYQFVQPAAITVEWNTETELQTAGFHLYRSQSPDGEFERVTDKLIPSQGDAVSGASYTFTDANVEPGVTYYYVLEEIEHDSSTNRYEADMFSHTVPSMAWWAIVLTAVSTLAGLALMFMGLRERKT
jgi:hypothetical protein